MTTNYPKLCPLMEYRSLDEPLLSIESFCRYQLRRRDESLINEKNAFTSIKALEERLCGGFACLPLVDRVIDDPLAPKKTISASIHAFMRVDVLLGLRDKVLYRNHCLWRG